jgi:hypothetical protein
MALVLGERTDRSTKSSASPKFLNLRVRSIRLVCSCSAQPGVCESSVSASSSASGGTPPRHDTQVARELDRLVAGGTPATSVSDNGPRLTARAILAWTNRAGVD